MEISNLRRYASESNEKLVAVVWEEKLSGEGKEKRCIQRTNILQQGFTRQVCGEGEGTVALIVAECN